MDKREIPRDHPNAAPMASIEAAGSRVKALGLDPIDATVQAGLGRATGYRLWKGEASLGSLKRLEDWLAKEEAKRPRAKHSTKDAKIAEWAELGAELARLDAARFDSMLDGLRDIVKAKKMEGNAILKMFRVNPDREE